MLPDKGLIFFSTKCKCTSILRIFEAIECNVWHIQRTISLASSLYSSKEPVIKFNDHIYRSSKVNKPLTDHDQWDLPLQ